MPRSRGGMKVEAVTWAKNPDDPAANEDRYLVVPGRAYAVIDGVSDKTGLKFDGLTGGQIAGRIVEQSIRHACDRPAADEVTAGELIGCFNERIHKAYLEYGLVESGRVAPPARFGAQLVLALQGRERFRFIVVGDCGLRLNGREVFLTTYPMDVIASRIRKFVWHHLREKRAEDELVETVARNYTLAGLAATLPATTRWPETARWLDAAALGAIRDKALAELATILPEVERGIIAEALDGGLAGQHRYRNRIHPLGYPALDGTPIPPELVVEFVRPVDSLETVEMFSDGYFGCAAGSTAADWEAWHARVEAEDPARVGAHPSTKGSYDGRFADDRTVVILRHRSHV